MIISNKSSGERDVAVGLEHVSKRFKVYHRRRLGPICEQLCFWRKGSDFFRENTVLDDISLQVRRGEVVGVIGANGAGKTTLLKIIAGMLVPDAGVVQVDGRVT